MVRRAGTAADLPPRWEKVIPCAVPDGRQLTLLVTPECSATPLSVTSFGQRPPSSSWRRFATSFSKSAMIAGRRSCAACMRRVSRWFRPM